MSDKERFDTSAINDLTIGNFSGSGKPIKLNIRRATDKEAQTGYSSMYGEQMQKLQREENMRVSKQIENAALNTNTVHVNADEIIKGINEMPIDEFERSLGKPLLRKVMNKPIHKHDCDECVFLGTERNVDFYYHPATTASLENVLARFSSDGSDYVSGIKNPVYDYHLVRALRLALFTGLIDDVRHGPYKPKEPDEKELEYESLKRAIKFVLNMDITPDDFKAIKQLTRIDNE